MYGSFSPLRVALGVSGSLLSLGLALVQAQVPATTQQQAPNAPGAVSAPPVPPGQGRPGLAQAGQDQAKHGQNQIGDRELAECLLIANQGEVAMAQFALQKTQNQEVRQFAEKLIEDHQKMIDSLRQAGAGGGAAAVPGQAGQAAATPGTTGQAQPAANTTAASDRRNSVNPGAAELLTGRGPAGGTDFASLHREMAQQCLQSSQRELGSKQGVEFDKCYVGMQIGAHQHAVDMLTVFRRHSSDQLGKTIDEGLPVVQAHLEHAKQLMKQMESGTPSTAKSSDQPKS
jgi:predicted outer membrane protein